MIKLLKCISLLSLALKNKDTLINKLLNMYGLMNLRKMQILIAALVKDKIFRK
jgi:hypothetical protein